MLSVATALFKCKSAGKKTKFQGTKSIALFRYQTTVFTKKMARGAVKSISIVYPVVYPLELIYVQVRNINYKLV